MLNKIHLIGRLGKDPEIRHSEGGTQIATFTLATSEKYKDKNGEKKEDTEWHNIVFFGKISETIEKYLTKGSLIYVEGKIKTTAKKDKQGNNKYYTNVVGSEMKILSGGSNDKQEDKENQGNSSNESEDDLPF